eukprot:gene425-biopygen160
MADMPESIDDIYNRNDALKGTKALATHYPAAPANDAKLDEKLPCPVDRQVRAAVNSGLFDTIAVAKVAPTFNPEPFQIPDGYAPSGSLTGKMQRGSIPRAGATPSFPTIAPSATVPPDDPVMVSDYVSSDKDIADHPGSSRQAPPVKPTTDRAPQAGAPTEPPVSPATTLPAMTPTEPTAPVRPRAKRAAKLPVDTPSPTRHACAGTPRTPDIPTCWPDSIPPPAPHHADCDHGFVKRIVA